MMRPTAHRRPTPQGAERFASGVVSVLLAGLVILAWFAGSARTGAPIRTLGWLASSHSVGSDVATSVALASARSVLGGFAAMAMIACALAAHGRAVPRRLSRMIPVLFIMGLVDALAWPAGASGASTPASEQDGPKVDEAGGTAVIRPVPDASAPTAPMSGTTTSTIPRGTPAVTTAVTAPGPTSTPDRAAAEPRSRGQNSTCDDAAWLADPAETWIDAATDHLQDRLGRTPTEAEVDRYFAQCVRANSALLADQDHPDVVFPGQRLEFPAPDGTGSIPSTL